MVELWKEVEVFAGGFENENITKQSLAHGLTESYIKQSEILQELMQERKETKKIQKDWRSILYKQEHTV